MFVFVLCLLLAPFFIEVDVSQTNKLTCVEQSTFLNYLWPLLLAMVEKPEPEVHTDNQLLPYMLSGREGHSRFGDRIFP
jgi:hypothetical protein